MNGSKIRDHYGAKWLTFILANTSEGLILPDSDSNQAREWYNTIKPTLLHEDILIFEQVLMMTSENIHINAFMYEPIIDISDWHLKQLYTNLKAIEQQHTP